MTTLNEAKMIISYAPLHWREYRIKEGAHQLRRMLNHQHFVTGHYPWISYGSMNQAVARRIWFSWDPCKPYTYPVNLGNGMEGKVAALQQYTMWN